MASLGVLVYGESVGELSAHEGRSRFTPDAAWLRDGQHPPLGLAFLTDPRPRAATGAAPSWFENLLPERGSPLRTWLCRQLGIRETNSLALLAAVGRDLPGAVEVVGEAAADVPVALPEEPESRLRFSLAGLQLKLSMILSENRFALPARGESGRWIVKIPGERYAELPQVESATMAWARAAGLPTPDFQVLPIEELQGVPSQLLGRPRHAFAIQRFDRKDDRRVHQEDFAQALDFRPEQKYGDIRPGASYDGVARLVRDACGIEAHNQFIARLAFVVASGNNDAHLKNWSFQWGHGHRPWLSPCYDLVATIAWEEFGWGGGSPTLALSLGRERRFGCLDRRCLTRFVERTGVAGAEEAFMRALARARDAWPVVAEQVPSRMREAVEEHWHRVPLLRRAGPLPRQ